MEVEKEAEKRAVRRIAELLSAPEHLKTTDQLRSNYTKKKSVIEAQIKSSVQTQLEESRESISLLNKSIDNSQKIRDDFGKIDITSKDGQDSIKLYGLIRETNNCRSNILATLGELDRLIKIPEQIQSIMALMNKDINILQVYGEVRQLEEMRDAGLSKAGNNIDELNAMEISYRGVQKMIEDFERKLFSLASNALALSQVIEREEKKDQILQSKLEAQGLDPYDDMNRKSFRRYRELFFQNLRNTISNRFDACFGKCEDIGQVVVEAQALLDDLTTVLDETIPCFPPNYKIFDFYFKEYHIRFNTQMLNYANNAEVIKPKAIIELVRWVRQEYEPQLAALGISDPQPPLIDTLEPLYQAYRVHISKLMRDWVVRIIEQDLDKDKNPIEIIDQLYYTLAPTNLFEFIHTQITVAKKAKDIKYVYEVFLECVETLSFFQHSMSDVLKSNDVAVNLLILSARVDELYLEYYMALVNNYSKSYDYVEDLTNSIPNLLPEPQDRELLERFEPIGEEFHNMAKNVLVALTDYIFSDMKEAMEQFFQKEWYEGKLMEQVIGCIESYFGDIEGHILESHFKKLNKASECLERIINIYIEQLFGKKHTLDKYTVETMSDDQFLLKEFFSKYARKNTVVASVQVIDDLKELLDADPDSIPLYFHSLLKNHPDVTVPIIEALLSMRYDLDKNLIAQAVEGCKKTYEETMQQMEREGVIIQQGVFSRLKLPSKITGWFSTKR